jgi:1-acyl-sn-glycerol-3-phosphate acyltransferase
MPRKARTPKAADATPEVAPIAEPQPVAEDIQPEEAARVEQDIEVEVHNQAEASSATAPLLQQMANDLLRLVRENAERLGGGALEQLQSVLKGGIGDYLDPDFWKGIGMVLEYQINELRALIQRRIKGEYSTDAYGRDDEMIELIRPLAGFLYRSWWRIRVSGLDQVPGDGGVLLVANHAGVVPWDGAMLATALLEDHASPRLTRILHEKLISSIPILAPTMAALGQVPAMPANAERLLNEGELVAVFPEGARGAGKLFRDRYTLRGFEPGPYIQAALRAKAAIVPVAVIGAEETYPVIFNLDKAAKLLGLPYLPITPLFPWAGLLGLIPLPSKWAILFGEPLDTSGLEASTADDSTIVAKLAATLKMRVEALIEQGLQERGMPF